MNRGEDKNYGSVERDAMMTIKRECKLLILSKDNLEMNHGSQEQLSQKLYRMNPEPSQDYYGFKG